MNRREVLSTMALSSAGMLLPFGVNRALASQPTLKFRDLYSRGRELTDDAKALEGVNIEMTGYMAPPLKPEIDFFVLTRLPMSVCPFCETEAQWPDDIVLSFAREPVEVVRYTDLIRVSGMFETGFKTDEETGFVSFVRLMDVSYRKL